MIDLPTAFNSALICILLYVVTWGGKAGRFGASFAIIATIFTYVGLGDPEPYRHLNILIFAGDALLLFGFVYIAFQSNRWWPIWASAMQLNGVSAHLVAALSTSHLSEVYYRMTSLWGVPILLIMTLGTVLDARAAKRGSFIEVF